MKTSIKTISFAALAFFISVTAACQASVNTNTSNTNVSNAANSAAVPPKTPDAEKKAEAGELSLATPTDAYKTAYMVRKKGDIEGLKKVMDADILEFLTELGQIDGKSLDDMLKELAAKPQADRAEVRNEKITGNTATIEYLTEKGDWQTMDFVKVGNEWKLTIPDAGPAEPTKK
ncbi:MAG: hypothetical protein IPM50_06430 [Acidobacteriota bacterium]|nr:MAG: hypothetical protein IPM50_06430 [Acidobacteriota bacterium]